MAERNTYGCLPCHKCKGERCFPKRDLRDGELWEICDDCNAIRLADNRHPLRENDDD